MYLGQLLSSAKPAIKHIKVLWLISQAWTIFMMVMFPSGVRTVSTHKLNSGGNSASDSRVFRRSLMPKPKVFITNRAGHDFTPAEEFGELIFMTEGQQQRFNVSRMYSQFCEFMSDSTPDDHILMTGLSHMNSIACSIFAFLHGRLNLLLYVGRGKYLSRTVVLSELLNKKEKEN